MKPLKTPVNGPLLLTAISWGFNFVALKVLYREMSPAAVALSRFLAVWVLLILFCLVRGVSLVPKKADILPILTTGFVATGAYMVLFMEGISRTTPADGAIVMATAPVFTYLLSCLFKQEKFLPTALAASAVAFVGVVLVILGGSAGGHGSVQGNLIILSASAVWAVSAVMMRPLLARYEPLQVLTLGMPGAMLALLPYGFRAMMATDFYHLTPNAWFMFSTVSILSGGIAFVFFYTGVRQIGASNAVMYQYLVPPIATFFSWTVLGRMPTLMQLGGLFIVLTGVAGARVAQSREAEKNNAALHPEPIPAES